MRKTLLLVSLLTSLSNCRSGSLPVDEVVTEVQEKFGQKFRGLKETILIDEPGVYDYEKVMHDWLGGGGCEYFTAKPAAMEIASDNVTIKNLGIKGAVRGIVFSGKEVFHNIKFINVEVYACYEALELPSRIYALESKDSRFVTKGVEK